MRSNKAHAAASKLPPPHFHVTSASVAAQASSCLAAPCFPHRRSSPSLPAPVVSRAFPALLSALPGDQTTPEEPRENGSHVHPAAAGFFCGLWVPELLVSCAALEQGCRMNLSPRHVSIFITRAVLIYAYRYHCVVRVAERPPGHNAIPPRIPEEACARADMLRRGLGAPHWRMPIVCSG